MREKSFDEELLEEEMKEQQLVGKTPEEYTGFAGGEAKAKKKEEAIADEPIEYG